MSSPVKKLTDGIILGVFMLSLCCFIASVPGLFAKSGRNIHTSSMPPLQEEFDPTYVRLDNMDKLVAFCDSLYATMETGRKYPGVVSEVIRKRFYHGYSSYRLSDNPSNYVLSKVLGAGLNATVIPNDILKFSNAACSQQSIVGMEIFVQKGYPVREVGMFDSVTNSGHFAYEVYYDNGWHFFDVDEEPSSNVLKMYNRPSTAFLAKHPEIVAAAYAKKPSPAKFQRLIASNKTGKVNRFPAPNAYLLHLATKGFNYFGFIIFGALVFLRVRYNRKARQKAAYLPQTHEPRIPSYSSFLGDTAVKG